MDNTIYVIINSSLMVILTIFAIVFPIIISIKSSNKMDETQKDILRIVAGIEGQTKNIQNDVRDFLLTRIGKGIDTSKKAIDKLEIGEKEKDLINNLINKQLKEFAGDIDRKLVYDRDIGPFLLQDYIDNVDFTNSDQNTYRYDSSNINSGNFNFYKDHPEYLIKEEDGGKKENPKKKK